MSLKSGSVMSELQLVQDLIQQINHRIGVLEKTLAQEPIINDREALESELAVAKKVLKSNEGKLLKLRKSNTKTFMVTACLIFIIFLLFGLYSMIFNVN